MASALLLCHDVQHRCRAGPGLQDHGHRMPVANCLCEVACHPTYAPD